MRPLLWYVGLRLYQTVVWLLAVAAFIVAGFVVFWLAVGCFRLIDHYGPLAWLTVIGWSCFGVYCFLKT